MCNISAESMTWQDYNELGDKMHKANWYKDAVTYYNKAIEIKPNEAILYFNRGVSKYCSKDYYGAIADFERTIYLNPNDNVAKSFLYTAKESVANSKQSAYNIGNTNYKNSSNYQPVVQKRAIPKRISWQDYYNNGQRHFNQKNYNAAISDYTNSIKLKPSKDYLYYSYRNRGAAYHNINEYEKAISDYSQAVGIAPKDSDIFICRGDSYLALKKYWKALDDYNISLKTQNLKDAETRINSLRQNFRNPSFLLTNYKDILEDLGYAQFWILLVCIFILIFVHPKRNNFAFKEYKLDDIYSKCKIWHVNINTPVPKPEDFHLERSRIDYLEKIYQESNKPFFSDYEESGGIVFWSIVLSLFFYNFMYKIISMYFDSISKDWSWIIIIGIPAIIIYFTLKKIPIFFRTNPDVTPHERQTYLLYKGALELYHKEMAPIKAAEEERQRKIREEEERKLKQQRSYWQKYWAEKQQNGFEFENAVGELYKKLGYKVTVTQGTGDGGVDLILRKSGVITIVQCKAHTHQVGPEPVRALWGVREDFNATEAIFIAYSGVTSGAIDFARGKKLQLLNVENLISLSIQAYADKN